MLEELKYRVRQTYNALGEDVGSVSEIDREQGLIVTAPECEEFRPEMAVVLDLDGNVIEGEHAPCADAQTHLELYRAFPKCGGIVHTYSLYATAFAQACKPIPPFGTAHVRFFRGEIPATRLMTRAEIENDYMKSIGLVIAEAFKNRDPAEVPGVLVSYHAPYAWGADCAQAAENARILEEIARRAMYTLTLTPGLAPVSNAILEKFKR